MRLLVIPIKQRFAQAILDGTKTVEVRKCLPRQQFDRMLLYETAPTAMVVGSVDVTGTAWGPSREIWNAFGDEMDLTESEFGWYMAGGSRGNAAVLHLENPLRLTTPAPLDVFGLDHMSQGYAYTECGDDIRALLQGGVPF